MRLQLAIEHLRCGRRITFLLLALDGPEFGSWNRSSTTSVGLPWEVVWFGQGTARCRQQELVYL